jgi:hypothetical protein
MRRFPALGRLVLAALALPLSYIYAGAQTISAPQSCSGTITLGGTAQNATIPTGNKYFFTLMNLSADIMWFSMTGTAAPAAAGSFALPAASTTAYSSYTTPATMALRPGGALSVVAATTSDAYSCVYWAP